MPLPVWLPTWLTNLLGGGWIRNALGIRKDLIDTKKSKLEVKKLEHEEKARNNLITPATMEDIEKYDPKTKELLQIVEVESHEYNELRLLLSRRDRIKIWLALSWHRILLAIALAALLIFILLKMHFS